MTKFYGKSFAQLIEETIAEARARISAMSYQIIDSSVDNLAGVGWQKRFKIMHGNGDTEWVTEEWVQDNPSGPAAAPASSWGTTVNQSLNQAIYQQQNDPYHFLPDDPMPSQHVCGVNFGFPNYCFRFNGIKNGMNEWGEEDANTGVLIRLLYRNRPNQTAIYTGGSGWQVLTQTQDAAIAPIPTTAIEATPESSRPAAIADDVSDIGRRLKALEEERRRNLG